MLYIQASVTAGKDSKKASHWLNLAQPVMWQATLFYFDNNMETNNSDTPRRIPHPEILAIWSIKMQGAREMLAYLQQQIQHGARIDLDPAPHGDGRVYTDAILRLALSSLENVAKYLEKRKIAYRNHKRNSRGKLVSCEAYFL